ncbi:hypothetical protein NIES22_44650 [Calothrix brevissima NIES-22]|nr:hypothetical protein NIES22_44650 [Calothrix brevissima NIES-22]
MMNQQRQNIYARSLFIYSQLLPDGKIQFFAFLLQSAFLPEFESYAFYPPKPLLGGVCHLPEKILSAAREIRSKSSFNNGGQSTPTFRPPANSC